MTRWVAVLLVSGCAATRTVYICEHTGDHVADAAQCTSPERARVASWRRAAVEALRAGDVLYDAGQFERALAFYWNAWGLQAYALRAPEYDTLFRAAQAARLGGHRGVAGWLYRVYLVRTAKDGATAFRAKATQWADTLNEELREPAACDMRLMQEVRSLVEEYREVQR